MADDGPLEMAAQPLNRPVAFVSDIHGNLAAFDRVLSELAAASVSNIVSLGNHLFGSPEAHPTWLRLVERNVQMIRGASDLALAALPETKLLGGTDEEKARAELFRSTRTSVGALVLERLRRLPDQLRFPLPDGRELLAIHGSPVDPMTHITHDLDDDEALSLVGDDPADIIVCSGDHTPFTRTIGELVIVGVGSLGKSPSGDVAHYTLVYPSVEEVRIEQLWAHLG